MLGLGGKYKNLSKYMLQYTKELVKQVKYQIETPRVRKHKRYTTNTPLNNTGSLARSISYEIKFDPSRGSYFYKIKGNDYAHVIEDGIKNRPPVSKIAQWIKSKPVTIRDSKGNVKTRTDAAVNNLAYWISESIAKNRKPVPFIQQSLDASMGGLSIEKLGVPITQDIAENIEQILIEAGYAKKGDEFILQ